jgi:hypothetical protein
MALKEISDVVRRGSSDRKLAALGGELSGWEATGSKNRRADVAVRANSGLVRPNEWEAEAFWRGRTVRLGIANLNTR